MYIKLGIETFFLKCGVLDSVEHSTFSKLGIFHGLLHCLCGRLGQPYRCLGHLLIDPSTAHAGLREWDTSLLDCTRFLPPHINPILTWLWLKWVAVYVAQVCGAMCIIRLYVMMWCLSYFYLYILLQMTYMSGMSREITTRSKCLKTAEKKMVWWKFASHWCTLISLRK